MHASKKASVFEDLLTPGSGFVVGRVAGISADGVASVVVAGSRSPLEVLSLLTYASEQEARAALVGSEVLLVFAANESRPPIMVGLVGNRLWSNDAGAQAAAAESVREEQHRSLSATEDLTLTCGKSSIQLRKDGSVIIKGVNVVSRASRSNRIKGPTINLN